MPHPEQLGRAIKGPKPPAHESVKETTMKIPEDFKKWKDSYAVDCWDQSGYGVRDLHAAFEAGKHASDREFYFHESLHTAHVLLCAWGEHVAESRAVMEDPDLLWLAEEATRAMAQFYQAIGAKY